VALWKVMQIPRLAFKPTIARPLASSSAAAFNVNSASVEAWRAFLGGLNESEVLSLTMAAISTALKIDHAAAFLRHSLPPDQPSLQGDYQEARDLAGLQGFGGGRAR
jgi:hypothetical protein